MFAFMLMLEAGEKRDKLEELYITYRKELYYVAYQILHNHYDAEDVIQNAFIKIAKFIDKINEIECKKTRAYLVIIVRRLCFDRYNEKKKTVPIDFMDETEEAESTGSSLDDYVLNLERGRELAESLSKINSAYADVLTLKYFYELDNDEIGELINLSPQNVSVKLTRAKIALRKILTEGENGNE
jgi:RNA polymerase sigma-70 factor (ECF subfamily)